MKLETSRRTFDQFCETARTYWEKNTLPAGEAVILVEALHPEFRVVVRNLTVANALRRTHAARLVMVTGSDRWWRKAIWGTFDVDLFRQLGAAFGAEVVDIHDLVDDHLERGRPLLPADLFAGWPTPGDGADGPATTLDPSIVATSVDTSYCRLLMVPRVHDEDRGSSEFQAIDRRTRAFADLYGQLIARLRPMAFVTSHVDYNQWGLAVTAAMQQRIPVIYVQQTGGLKAYAAFPERAHGSTSIRAVLTDGLADVFERAVWPRRRDLRTSAELVAWRSKGNLGRPIWWRRGAGSDAELANGVERGQMREVAMRRLGLDRDKPVVVVFNHAVSDAIGSNVEAFDDLADWFEQTAAFAARDQRANWLFLDHPHQRLYDSTDFVKRIAARHRRSRHLHFTDSSDVGKNLLWSLVDLGVTVRGSVSNELPAFGMPVLQAGWSDWSGCGLSQVAGDQATYWRYLESDLAALVAGEPVITSEQVERARLWLWFYRTATDVVTPLIPHWHEGGADDMVNSLSLRLQHIESDGDPAFESMHRLWQREDAVLTRFDLDSFESYASTLLRLDPPA